MLKVMAFLVKKQGLDTRDLIDYYETHHVPLILSLAPAPATYRRKILCRRGVRHRGPQPLAATTGDVGPCSYLWFTCPIHMQCHSFLLLSRYRG